MNSNFTQVLADELSRIDAAGIAKRHETVIDSFVRVPGGSPRARITGTDYLIFNSNDYLGLRFSPALRASSHAAEMQFGVGPGAVRFISGSLAVHRELERKLAAFHGRQSAVIFSSAFAANLACLTSLIRGGSKDSLLTGRVLVLSDELNHRSIVDGIRLAQLPADQRLIYHHLDYTHLETILAENTGKYDRVLIVSDGVFSMLGEIVDLKVLRSVVGRFDDQYQKGCLLYIDDAHGIGAVGPAGRGVEELAGARADLLVGTLGKAFGTDGGYAVGDTLLVDFLRESAATYIYSNNLPPGTAAAAAAAVSLVDSPAGLRLLARLNSRIARFKSLMSKTDIPPAADSRHPIQPLLMGDPRKALDFKNRLFAAGILVTAINYPVVPSGRDEIRVQISASHSLRDLEFFASVAKSAYRV